MKKPIILLSIIFFSAAAYAQSFIAETYVERTKSSPKIGSSIGYQFAGKFEIGGFIQKSTVIFVPEIGIPLENENNFYGAFFSYPLKSTRKLDLHVRVRTGVSNDQNFTITPNLSASYTPTKLISVSTGVGVRSFRPTLMASIKINLFGKKADAGLVASLDNSSNNQ